MGALLLLCTFFFTGRSGLAQTYDYDILIKNARVLDGSLKQAFQADVAIKGANIAKIEKSISGSAKKIINAKGLHLSPGFIDLHTHAGRDMYVPENRPALNYLKQGVTTLIVGQCGGSAWPIFEKARDLFQRWRDEGIGPNVASLVGQGSVREIVMGRENREPTPQEMEEMKALVKEAMEQGAYGFSTGLRYVPGSYSETDEIIEVMDCRGRAFLKEAPPPRRRHSRRHPSPRTFLASRASGRAARPRR